jgi:hypothetical protein
MITSQSKDSAGFFNKPAKKVADVIDNAHSGSPFIVPWVPQLRREQPNERIKSFSKKATEQVTGTTVPWSVGQITAKPSK